MSSTPMADVRDLIELIKIDPIAMRDRWRAQLSPSKLSPSRGNAICGVSGGRTSALLAHLVDAIYSFQNTGREAAGTYDFISRLEQDLEQPIVRLEFRAPRRGDPPKMATFEIVEHRHLARKGEPFRDLLECLRTYRAKHKGLGPVAPWARSRICTAYLKIRTQRKYCASLGWTPGGRHLDYIEYTGLRFDETDRVSRMRKRNDDLDTDECAPLSDLKIDKAMVLAWWASRPFDLEVPEEMGNCTGCFLKDERDLATALSNDETDAPWWIDIEKNYAPMRRGGRPSYEQIVEELDARMEIRRALAEGRAYSVDLDAKRVSLIVRQELAPRSSFSCECDAAKGDEFDDMIEAV